MGGRQFIGYLWTEGTGICKILGGLLYDLLVLLLLMRIIMVMVMCMVGTCE